MKLIHQFELPITRMFKDRQGMVNIPCAGYQRIASDPRHGFVQIKTGVF